MSIAFAGMREQVSADPATSSPNGHRFQFACEHTLHHCATAETVLDAASARSAVIRCWSVYEGNTIGGPLEGSPRSSGRPFVGRYAMEPFPRRLPPRQGDYPL